MNKETKEGLIKSYKRSFCGKWEKGGGYNFRFFHGLRVMKYCERFLQMRQFKKLGINQDVLLTGALFHDIGKIQAISKTGEIIYGSEADLLHEEIGAAIVVKHVGKFFKNKNVIVKIGQLISEQSGSQKMIEAKLVKDADRLDNYGFIQIWRHITYAQQAKKNLDRLFEYWIDERVRESTQEYFKKFNFPVIRKIAEKRFRKLDYLINEMREESGGLDIK